MARAHFTQPAGEKIPHKIDKQLEVQDLSCDENTSTYEISMYFGG